MKTDRVLTDLALLTSCFIVSDVNAADHPKAPGDADEVSKPSDRSVTVRDLAAGWFAVMRYSGGRNAKNEAESLAGLRAWMKEEGMKELSPPVYGYFDPPWIPAFLRRNEVMLLTETGRP